ncbi:hypothetical protein NHH82_15270 [Oxalobacteraceae bacterium OTU3REALA1]|nr:hypothetical protein NHH82_15270 [Oxalobacteraceae bacterium OTU3REALA1]
MSASLYRTYAPLFYQLFSEPRGRRSLLRVSSFLLVFFAVGTWLLLALLHRPDAAGAFGGVGLTGLLWLWCAVFVSSAACQNHPANACLVPHLHRRLIVLCVVLFVVSSLLLATMISVFFGHFGYALAVAGVLFPFVLLMERFVYIGLLPVLASPLSHVVPTAWSDRLTASLAGVSEPTLSVLGVAADIVLLAWGLRMAFPRGGDSHFARADRRALWQAAGSDAAALRELQRRRVWRKGYERVLRRDSVASAAPGRKMMHAMGTTVNEESYILRAVMYSLATVLAALANIPDFKIFGPMTAFGLVQATILMSIPSYTGAVLSAASTHNAEQGLYRLTPGAPYARDLNRVLAKTVLLRFLKIWLVVLAGLVCVDFAQQGGLVLRSYPLAMASLTLPFLCTLLPDYARLRAGPRVGVIFGLPVTLVLVYLVCAAVAARYPGFPWLVPAGFIAACSLLTLWVQWISMIKMAPAFPAGRLAA